MPNWVCCGFVVTGDPAELARFRSRMFRKVRVDRDGHGGDAGGFETIFDFDAIIPMPAAAADFDPQGWAVENWGTKWNAMNVHLGRRSEDHIHFQFDTAWDFPTPVFHALANEFPTLVFSGSAFEDNGGFALEGQFNGSDSWRLREDSTSPTEDDEEE